MLQHLEGGVPFLLNPLRWLHLLLFDSHKATSSDNYPTRE